MKGRGGRGGGREEEWKGGVLEGGVTVKGRGGVEGGGRKSGRELVSSCLTCHAEIHAVAL